MLLDQLLLFSEYESLKHEVRASKRTSAASRHRRPSHIEESPQEAARRASISLSQATSTGSVAASESSISSAQTPVDSRSPIPSSIDTASVDRSLGSVSPPSLKYRPNERRSADKSWSMPPDVLNSLSLSFDDDASKQMVAPEPPKSPQGDDDDEDEDNNKKKNNATEKEEVQGPDSADWDANTAIIANTNPENSKTSDGTPRASNKVPARPILMDETDAKPASKPTLKPAPNMVKPAPKAAPTPQPTPTAAAEDAKPSAKALPRRSSLKKKKKAKPLTPAQIRARKKAEAEKERQAELEELFVMYGVDPATVKPDEIPALPDWSVKPYPPPKPDSDDDISIDEMSKDGSKSSKSSKSSRDESFSSLSSSFSGSSNSRSRRGGLKSAMSTRSLGSNSSRSSGMRKGSSVRFLVDPNIQMMEDDNLKKLPPLEDGEDPRREEGGGNKRGKKTRVSFSDPRGEEDDDKRERKTRVSFSETAVSSDMINGNNTRARRRRASADVILERRKIKNDLLERSSSLPTVMNKKATTEQEWMMEAQRSLASLSPEAMADLLKIVEKSGSSTNMNELKKKTPKGSFIVESQRGVYHVLDPKTLMEFVATRATTKRKHQVGNVTVLKEIEEAAEEEEEEGDDDNSISLRENIVFEV